MREKISELPEEETTRILKLPNSYYERGLKHGLDKGLQRVIKNMVKKDFSNKEIAEITGLYEFEVEKMKERFGKDM